MLTGSHATTTDAAGIRYYGDGRCRSIWRWQLILAFTIVAIGVGVALLTPRLLTDPAVSSGMLLIILVTVVSLAVPWNRFGQGAVLVLPVLNALAIGLIYTGADAASAFLWVFPVAWVASYYSAVTLVAMLALICTMLMTNLGIRGFTVAATLDIVMLMIAMSFVGVIMFVGSERNRSVRQLLRGQSARLGHALQRVNQERARNRRLLDSLEIGVARVVDGGVVVMSNSAFHRIYALEEQRGYHHSWAVEYDSRRGQPVPARQMTIARASRGELFENHTVWLFGLDGRWRAIRATTRPIENGDFADDGVLLVVEEITENVDPRAGDDARRRTISHELRNPLTAVLGHIDLLLERDDLSAPARTQLDVIERAGSRMEQLIDQVLAAPAAEADDQAVDFDLARVTLASVEGFLPTADASGVLLDVCLSEPLRLRADAFRLRQVLDNLVSNAIKYAQRGGKVTVHGARPTVDEVSIVITDTGIGIAEDDLPRIFEPEFRTEHARRQGIPGTGLGLAISREIVVAQGGRLEVQSRFGEGTQVTVTLPSSSQERLSQERMLS
ncbi:HAMP domain-containing sensor histidine kinase [Microbacterium sp. Mu-80]|uniref:histidine kinase n=1 Tax=Microbacterium bandirmense TaxID=3122050 RepID=A0ABU8LE72_9MICO